MVTKSARLCNNYSQLEETAIEVRYHRWVCKCWERFNTQYMTIQSVGEATNCTASSGMWPTLRLRETQQTVSWKWLSGDAFRAGQYGRFVLFLAKVVNNLPLVLQKFSLGLWWVLCLVLFTFLIPLHRFWWAGEQRRIATAMWRVNTATVSSKPVSKYTVCM